MIEEHEVSESAEQTPAETPPAEAATTKKTTKKTAKRSSKKTTKKAAAKKTAKKPAKKTAKKAAKKTTSRSSKKTTAKSSAAAESSEDATPDDAVASTPSGPKPFARLVVNYVPGEECRVALMEDGKLQEYEAERFDAISRVGNIYLGRVTNVEAGIQAAFVDFGVEEAGFLHVSDLHPRYFPGEGDSTERVGKKTPRRERPPIEKTLKKGQLIVVQVLKDGVGTKGPALTSYLSIPGRFLVMMPEMDKVGVSRSIEDDDTRRSMRETLDQLELPDGFGFILRTAGLGRNKTELKRDLSYLKRLWKDLEARKKGAKPRLLYSESDLLVRTIRDQLTSEIDEVVIDSDVALGRVGQFMKIVAPKASTSVRRYAGTAPIFQAFDVERQIDQMFAREVPLPSGGRLVIDETEALVAIDVNSGRMRSRDAEQNAYRCNLEAVDEISRQLRLRDLGGLVINDLIDMRSARHRKDVENRFRDNLKRDKAKSTILPISEFGICEMTRQRMKASHESKHFAECPTCNGRGLVQRPASVADDALRSIDALLSIDRVGSAELVISSRVSGELLSSRRLGLGRLERKHGKHVEVRVSDTLGVDQVRFYAYDEGGSDIEIGRLPGPTPGERCLEDWSPGDEDSWAVDLTEEAEEAAAEAIATPEDLHEITTPGLEECDEESGGTKKRRRRRRRRRGRGGEGHEDNESRSGDDEAPRADEPTEQEQSGEAQPESPADNGDEQPKKKRRRRRRGRGGRGSGESNGEQQAQPSSESDSEPEAKAEPESHAEASDTADGEPKKKRRRRSRRGRGKDENGAPSEPKTETKSEAKPDAAPKSNGDKPAETPTVTTKPSAPRTLYRTGRRKLSASEISRIGMEE